VFAVTPPPQANEPLLRVIGMLDPPEPLMNPQVLARFAAHKGEQYIPAPLKRIATAVMPPAVKGLFGWHSGGTAGGGAAGGGTTGGGTSGGGTAGGGTAGSVGSEAALAELMCWPVGWREPQAVNC
jgi:hypothetical protein